MTNRMTSVKRAAPSTARTLTEWLVLGERAGRARVRPRTLHNQREGLKRLAKSLGEVNAATVTARFLDAAGHPSRCGWKLVTLAP